MQEPRKPTAQTDEVPTKAAQTPAATPTPDVPAQGESPPEDGTGDASIEPDPELPPPPGGEEKKNRNKGRKWLWALLILLLFLLLAIVLRLAGVYTFPWENSTPQSAAIAGDLFPEFSDAVDGMPDGLTQEEIEKRMQETADEAYFNLRVDARPVFPDGESEGKMLIENPASNVYPIRVQVELDETGEIIYDSGGILPNQYVNHVKLTKVLKKGEYACTANVYQYDPDTLVAAGKTQVAMIVTIEN